MNERSAFGAVTLPPAPTSGEKTIQRRRVWRTIGTEFWRDCGLGVTAGVVGLYGAFLMQPGAALDAIGWVFTGLMIAGMAGVVAWPHSPSEADGSPTGSVTRRSLGPSATGRRST